VPATAKDPEFLTTAGGRPAPAGRPDRRASIPQPRVPSRKNPALAAVLSQLASAPRYPGVDRWVNTLVPKGSVIWAGEPGAVGFFTTTDSIQRTDRDAVAFSRGLQIAAYRNTYRTSVLGYLVTRDVPAAAARAIANHCYGRGGLPQLFIPEFDDDGVLKVITSAELRMRYGAVVPEAEPAVVTGRTGGIPTAAGSRR
jgi:hypothetical protein